MPKPVVATVPTPNAADAAVPMQTTGKRTNAAISKYFFDDASDCMRPNKTLKTVDAEGASESNAGD
jgi:hypothetical protein